MMEKKKYFIYIYIYINQYSNFQELNSIILFVKDKCFNFNNI